MTKGSQTMDLLAGRTHIYCDPLSVRGIRSANGKMLLVEA